MIGPDGWISDNTLSCHFKIEWFSNLKPQRKTRDKIKYIKNKEHYSLDEKFRDDLRTPLSLLFLTIKENLIRPHQGGGKSLHGFKLSPIQLNRSWPTHPSREWGRRTRNERYKVGSKNQRNSYDWILWVIFIIYLTYVLQRPLPK